MATQTSKLRSVFTALVGLSMVATALLGVAAANDASTVTGWTADSTRLGNTATVTIAQDETPDVSDIAATDITGRGASFAGPIMNFVAPGYSPSEEGHTYTYGICGSSCGVRSVFGAPKDSDFETLGKPERVAGPNPGDVVKKSWSLFGVSEAPLQADEHDKAESEYNGVPIHIPFIMSAVTVSYNVPGLNTGDLEITPQQISDIYLGRITNWNQLDSSYPDLEITPVHRCDGSGTSFVFTDFLARATDDGWTAEKEFYNANPNLDMDLTRCGDGNIGVAGTVMGAQASEDCQDGFVANHGDQCEVIPAGGFGYVELGTANGIGSPYGATTYAKVQNQEGNYILPTEGTIKNAADAISADLPQPWERWSDVSLNWAPGADSYPATSFSYIIAWGNPYDVVHNGDCNASDSCIAEGTAYADYYTPAEYAVAKDVIAEILTTFQADIPKTGAVPLADSTVELGFRALDAMNWGERVDVEIDNVALTGFPVVGQTVSIDTETDAFDIVKGEFTAITGPVSTLNEGQFVQVESSVLAAGPAVGVQHGLLNDGSVVYDTGYTNGIDSDATVFQGQVINGQLLLFGQA